MRTYVYAYKSCEKYKRFTNIFIYNKPRIQKFNLEKYLTALVLFMPFWTSPVLSLLLSFILSVIHFGSLFIPCILTFILNIRISGYKMWNTHFVYQSIIIISKTQKMGKVTNKNTRAIRWLFWLKSMMNVKSLYAWTNVISNFDGWFWIGVCVCVYVTTISFKQKLALPWKFGTFLRITNFRLTEFKLGQERTSCSQVRRLKISKNVILSKLTE